jgi:hypothetical protein
VYRPCDACGTIYEAKTKRSRFHTPNCRVAYHRGVRPPAHLSAVPPTEAAPPPPLSETVVDTVRRDLERAGRLDTWLGQSALAMAKVLATGVGTPAGLSSANRELRETMAAALRGATTPGSAVVQHRDELAEWRAKNTGA